MNKIIKIKNNQNKTALHGIRVVGLKSRTKFENSELAMGIDFNSYKFMSSF